MKRALTHDEALDAIAGTVGVTVLSYQEAIESYLMLRRLECLFTAQASQTFYDPEVREASAIEAPSGVETGNTDSTEGESAAREAGDAQ